MKAPDIDWRYLRRGMLLPMVAVLAGLVILGMTTVRHERLLVTLGAAQERLAEKQRVNNQRIGKTMAENEFAADYQRLISSGTLGAERRLHRIQALRDAVEILKLPYTRYAISNQQTFSASYLPAGLAAPVYASRLHLQIGLGHELDLLRLIRRLRHDPGLFHVRSCELTRVSQTGELSASQPNIVGECSIDWLTIPAHTDSDIGGVGT